MRFGVNTKDKTTEATGRIMAKKRKTESVRVVRKEEIERALGNK